MGLDRLHGYKSGRRRAALAGRPDGGFRASPGLPSSLISRDSLMPAWSVVALQDSQMIIRYPPLRQIVLPQRCRISDSHERFVECCYYTNPGNLRARSAPDAQPSAGRRRIFMRGFYKMHIVRVFIWQFQHADSQRIVFPQVERSNNSD